VNVPGPPSEYVPVHQPAGVVELPEPNARAAAASRIRRDREIIVR